MTQVNSVLERPEALQSEVRSATIVSLSSRFGAAFDEDDLKAMRAALDNISTRFHIGPGSTEYQSAAIAVVRLASAGNVEAGRLAEFAALQLGLDRSSHFQS